MTCRILLACLLVTACQHQSKGKDKDKADAGAASAHEAVARDFVNKIGKGDFAGAVLLAKDHKLAVDQLKQIWDQSAGKGGPYQGIAAVSTQQGKAGRDIVIVSAQLAAGKVDVFVVMAPGENLIRGLHMEPLDEYQPAAYSDAAKLACQHTSLAEDTNPLPAILCLPKGGTGFPLLVLVGGSGPEDRDEHIGKMWPFRDLAEGLASRGIAVLRFDKRTYGHLGSLAVPDLTVKEEYLDDVKAAVATAAAVPGVDPKRIFLLGHSEGGWLIPWLIRDNPSVAGGILMAGHARPFASLIPAQERYKAMLDGNIDVQESYGIAIVEEQAKHSLDPKLSPDTPPTQLLLGVYPKYWLSIVGYDAPAVAKALAQPLLILQGGRDYNVTADDDLALWKRSLAGKTNVETELYPKLNHVFVAGEGKITPDWVTGAGHVDPAPIERIAAWIAKH